jgi:hypothetical protein
MFVRRTIRVGINTNKMINVEKKEMICPRCMGKGFVDLDDNMPRYLHKRN